VAGTTGRVGVLGPGKPDTADSTASLALASLTPGAYDIVVRSEHRTTGPYRLDIFLAGDVNGDQKVDDADIGMVAGLAGVKAGAASYVALADVDRNGVIDGGDRERAEKNAGAMAGQIQAGNPLDTFLPADALTLVGASPEGFNSRTAPLRFRLVGAKFDVENVADFSLTINGDAVATHLLAVDAHLLTANVGLADGRNDIALKAYDTVGRPLYFQRTLWAGSATLQVKLVNPDGSPFLQSATVAAVLSDDEVAQQARTTTGTAVFKYVPSRTILVKAQGAGNQTGTAGVIGSQGVVTITMGGGRARPIGRP
jgi:hypothetical protein